MVASMLNGDSRVAGNMTSGGTESILMAMKSYRDRARKLYPHIKNPEVVRKIVHECDPCVLSDVWWGLVSGSSCIMTHRPKVVPITIHPAFEKAAAYFDLTMVHCPIGEDYRVDIGAVAEAITPNTILLVGSAPQYCHGVVDPIEELSELALRHNLPLHVDACFGGFMLPWVEKLGYPVPKWDFRVPGVTSISVGPLVSAYCWMD